MLAKLLLLGCLPLCFSQNASEVGLSKLKEVFSWKTFQFEGNVTGLVSDFPNGIEVHKWKMFFTFPRRNTALPMTLGYISLLKNKGVSSPVLKPYPSAAANNVSSPGALVSAFRPRVDCCDRLWLVDTGTTLIRGSNIRRQSPAIVIIDLIKNRIIRRYRLRNGKDYDNGNPGGLISITVDVSRGGCRNAFAYIPDLQNYRLLVYSFKINTSWRVRHNTFFLDPLQGDFNLVGYPFQWDDGIVSVALGPEAKSGYRNAYFHALSSYNERMVNTKILRNRTLATRDYHNDDFITVGVKGPNSQTTSHVIDPDTGVMLMAEVGRSAITCWNTAHQTMSPANVATLAQSSTKMLYPSDIKIDEDANAWVFSNKLPLYLYSQLNASEVNFRVYKFSIDRAIRRTVCDEDFLKPPTSTRSGRVTSRLTSSRRPNTGRTTTRRTTTRRTTTRPPTTTRRSFTRP